MIPHVDTLDKWDRRFIALATVIGSWSKDPATQVGCLLVRDRRIIATGYNGAPRGVDETAPDRNERPEKYYWYEHAERNAIYNCAREAVSTEGATAYLTPLSPCADCARAFVQSGVVRVVTALTDAGVTRIEHESFQRGYRILKEGGVDLILVRFNSDKES